jgi:hypothetical protein
MFRHRRFLSKEPDIRFPSAYSSNILKKIKQESELQILSEKVFFPRKKQQWRTKTEKYLKDRKLQQMTRKAILKKLKQQKAKLSARQLLLNRKHRTSKRLFF